MRTAVLYIYIYIHSNTRNVLSDLRNTAYWIVINKTRSSIRIYTMSRIFDHTCSLHQWHDVFFSAMISIQFQF